jgi:hypothetical protein
MSLTDRGREGPDQTSGVDSPAGTSANLAKEGVSDDEQAPKYEPNFKSFSGHDGEQALPRVTDGESKNAGNGNDWFGMLMRRLGMSKDVHDQSNTQQVSEFVIEDQEAHKEHTASGERYIARASYTEGLKAQVKDAQSIEEADNIQGIVSIEYMLRKAREMGFAVISELLPKESEQPCTFSDPQGLALENHLRQRNNVLDATFVATNDNYASDATQPAALEPIKPRRPDAGVTYDVEFPSPPDVVTVHQNGVPGAVIARLGVQEGVLPLEMKPEDFAIEVFNARCELVKANPAAPPLVCLDVTYSAEGTATRPAVASKLAQTTGDWVLGKTANGDFRLFDPNGDATEYKITDPKSAEQWEKIREITAAHFAYNRGMDRYPDYREPDLVGYFQPTVTRAPSDVISVSCHGVPGKPVSMPLEKFVETVKSTKANLLAHQDRDHRKLHEPMLIEVLSCDSSAGPAKSETNKDEKNSMAARIAHETHSWTIGYGSQIDRESGRTHTNADFTKGEPAVLFDPEGNPRERFSTPLTKASWDKIRKYTETHRLERP